MCQLKEQGLFSVDPLLMDCINLKFVRWLKFNSNASYWLEIFLIHQPIDLKSVSHSSVKVSNHFHLFGYVNKQIIFTVL